MPIRRAASMPATATARFCQLAYFLACLLLVVSLNQISLAQKIGRHGPTGAGTRPQGIAAASSPESSLAAQLDDFILADFAILSGLDGSLTAIDRATGQTRWTLKGQATASSRHAANDAQLPSSFGPLIGSHYGKRQSSLASMLAASSEDKDDEHTPSNSPLEGLPARTRHLLSHSGMYVVEPGSSGRLYLLTSTQDTDDAGDVHHQRSNKARLQRLPLTLPQLVGLSPFSFPGEKGRIFTGSKKTRLLRIDVFTGELDRTWDADGSEVSSAFDHEEEGDNVYRWTYLARTDYTLSISVARRPHLAQTLHYSTYSHQSSDGDVASRWLDQHRGTSAPRHAVGSNLILPAGLDKDGRGSAKIAGWNISATGTRQAWSKAMDSQVVDVFDLLLPSLGQSSPSHTHPVLVPHPPLAIVESGSPSSVADYFDASPEDSVEPPADETLLTISPQTGSLYALSSRRFPTILRDVRPAFAGLDEAERSSRALVPGSSGPPHDPMHCQTFGCWMGRYVVEEEGRSPLGDSMGRLRIDSGFSSGRPLGISDRAANPGESSNHSRDTSVPGVRPSLPSRFLSKIPTLSKKSLATQTLALLLIVALTSLVRRGLNEQTKAEDARRQALVQDLGLDFTDLSDTRRNGVASISAGTKDEDPRINEPDDAEMERIKPVEERQKDADEAAAALLAEESKAKFSGAAPGGEQGATPTKKKRRRPRGKRAGAVVRARQGQGDDESGSEAEGEGGVEGSAGLMGKSNTRGPNNGLKATPNGSIAATLKEGWIEAGPDSKSAQEQVVALAATNSQPVVNGQAGSSALEITDEILGYGSSGTVVFKGRFQSRLVAVKRLLVDFVHLASQEISLLESADDHPNVIRYFYKEQIGNFLFIALELCPASLGDLVEKPDEWKDLSVKLEPKKAIAQIASGLRHLHALSIVHRDIKPQNILVAYSNPHSPATSSLKMLLSDFGLSKRLDSVAQSSFSQTMHHPGGTAGWRAPEILRGEVSLDDGSSSSSSMNSVATNSQLGVPSIKRERMRLTRAVDIFALGCLSYYLLTSGDHPYGARYEREINIMRNQANLSRLAAFGEEGFEASHLILSMIQPEPIARPRAIAVLSHPYFWDSAKRLAFLQDVSDRLEVIERERDVSPAATAAPPSIGTHTATEAEGEVLRNLESQAREVTSGGDWTKKVDKAFIDDLGKWRKYSGGSVRDLLRALRNKKHHYQDMPAALRRSMGPMPDGFLMYFTRRFPKLFLHVYEVVSSSNFIRTEATFKNYFAQQDKE